MSCSFTYKGVVYASKEALIDQLRIDNYLTASSNDVLLSINLTPEEFDFAVKQADSRKKVNGINYIEQNFVHGNQVTARPDIVALYPTNPSSIQLVKDGIRTRSTRAKTWINEYGVPQIGDYWWQASKHNPSDRVLTRITNVYSNTSINWENNWQKEGWVKDPTWSKIKAYPYAIEFEVVAMGTSDTAIDNLIPSLPTVPFKFTNYILHSGGAVGADSLFSDIGQLYGLGAEKHYYYGDKTNKGNTVLETNEIREGIAMGKRIFKEVFKRKWIKTYEHLQGRNWFQVKNADAIYAISNLLKPGELNKQGFANEADKTIVAGGTGTAVEEAIYTLKPVYVYNQATLGSYEEGWYKWNFVDNRYDKLDAVPTLTLNFAGIGSRELTDNGKAAIEDLFYYSSLTQAEATKVESEYPALKTEFTVKPVTADKIKVNTTLSNVFPTTNEQDYSFRVLANFFITLTTTTKFKTLGELESGSADSIKHVLLGSISKWIKAKHGVDSVYFNNFAKVYNEMAQEDSELWNDFKHHLSRYHGYKILDLEELIDDEGELPRNFNDNSQFTINRSETIRSEIKNLFNTTPKIVEYSRTEDDSIKYDNFKKLRTDTNTFFGVPDTLQWSDYTKLMFFLMHGANSKLEMLDRLRIASSVNTSTHKPLYAIYKQLQENDELLTIWYTQFHTSHPRVILDTFNDVNDIFIHNPLISNSNTNVKDAVTIKWLESINREVLTHISTSNAKKEETTISKFINELDNYRQALTTGATNLEVYYQNLAKLVNGIGIDLTATELEYLNVNNSRGIPTQLISTFFIPMGYLKTTLTRAIDPTVKTFQINEYSNLSGIAKKLEIFRFDSADLSSFGANKEIRQSINPSNFYSNWFSTLKSVSSRNKFLKELARIPAFQHNNILWAEPDSNYGLLHYHIIKENGIERKIPSFIGHKEAIELTPDVINDDTLELDINHTFLNAFEMLHFEGVKDVQHDRTEEYATFDVNMRYLSDILAYYNNIDTKNSNLKHYSLKSNGDRSWTVKIAATSTAVNKSIRALLLTKTQLNLADKIAIGKSEIFRHFKNIIEQDIDEITIASKLLFGDENGIVKFTDGKFTVSKTVLPEKLITGYHFQELDKNGFPILLDKKGMPTGNVFKPRRLQHRTVQYKNTNSTIIFADKLSIFKNGAILTYITPDGTPTARSAVHDAELNNYVIETMQDIAKATLIEFWKIKDKLLIAKRKDGTFIFESEDDLRNKVVDFSLNEYVFNNEQSNLWYGSPGEYIFKKDTHYLDFVKRAVGPSAFHTSAHPWVSNGTSSELQTTFKTLTVDDIELKDVMLAHKANITHKQLLYIGAIKSLPVEEQKVSIDKVVKANPKDKASLKQLTLAEQMIVRDLKAYYNINISDGFSIMSYSEFKNRLNVFGFTSKYKSIIDKLDRKEKISIDEYANLVESLKEVYYHREYDEYTGVYKTKFVKDAKFILIPGYILSDQLRKLSKFMETNTIGEIQFNGSNKIIGGQRVSITNSKGNIIAFTPVVTDYLTKRVQTNYYKNVGLQQSISSVELDGSNKLAVQISKIIWDNISSSKIYNIRGDKYTGQELFHEFGTLFGSQIQNSINEIITEFKGKLELRDGKWQANEDGEIINYEEFTKYIVGELRKQGVDKNIMWALKFTDNGKTNVPIYGNMHSKKILSVAESIFTNRVIRQEHPGPHSVLVSNAFTSDDRAYKSDSFLNTGNVNFTDKVVNDINNGLRTSKLETKVVSDSEGNEIIKMEVVIAPWSKAFIKENEIIDINELSEEVRTLIGYRIPTDGKSNVMYIEVVGFLKSGSNQIYVPDEIIARAGIDFDIDTEYMMAYNTYTNRKGEVKLIPYYKDPLDTNKRWDAYVKYTKQRNKAIISNSLTQEIKDKYEALEFIISEHIPFRGSSRTRMLIAQRQQKYNEIQLAKENKTSKYKIDGLFLEFNALSLEISSDIAYMEYLEQVTAKGKDQVRENKQQLIATNKDIEELNRKVEQSLIDNNLIPSKAEFNQLSISDQNTPPARQNRILDVFISVLSNPIHEYELQTSNTFDGVQDSKEIVDELLGEDARLFDSNNYIDKIELTKRVLQTRNLKGRVVAHKASVSIMSKMMTQIAKESAIVWTYKPSQLKLTFDELVALYGVQNVVLEVNKDITITHTFIGNNLRNNGVNMANKFINSIIQEIQSNMFDAVKFPMSLNLDATTLNVFLMLPSFGISHTITNTDGQLTDNAFIGADLFIHQPVIRELVDEINYRSSTAYVGNRSGQEIFDIKMKYLTKLYLQIKDTVDTDDTYKKLVTIFNKQLAKYDTIYITSKNKELANQMFGFDIDASLPLSLTDLMDGININDNSADSIKYQISTINTWSKLDTLRGIMFKYIQLFTQDKAKYAISTSNNNNDLISELKNNTMLYTMVDNKVTSLSSAVFDYNKYPTFNVIKNQAIDVADKIISPLVITEHPIVKNVLKDIYSRYEINKPELRERIARYLTNLPLGRLPIFSTIKGDIEKRIAGVASVSIDPTIEYDIDHLAFADLNIEDKITVYKALHPELLLPIHSNHILNKLSIKNREEEIAKNGYVRLDYAGTDNDDTIASFITLYNDPTIGRILVEDLIRYAYVMNDLTYGFNISKVIPYEVLNKYGYSQILTESKAFLDQAYSEINETIVLNDLPRFTAQQYYYDSVVKDLYFSDTNINSIDHFMDYVYKREKFNKLLVPILNKQSDKNGDAILVEKQGVFIIDNYELDSKQGRYFSFNKNKFVRIKGTANSNKIQLASRYDIFDVLNKKEYNTPITIKLSAKDHNGNSAFKNLDNVNFAVGNIVRFNAPFRAGQEQEFINLKILAKIDSTLIAEKTVIAPFHLEHLYKRLRLGDTDGKTIYYPIDGGLPNQTTPTEIDAFKARISESEYVTKIIPELAKVYPLLFANVQEEITNLESKNELDLSVILGDTNPVMLYNLEGNTKELLNKLATAIIHSINTTETTTYTMHDDENLRTIFESNSGYYSKLLRSDLEELNLATLRKGLAITENIANALIGNYNENNLRSIFDNNDPTYWNDVIKGGKEHIRLMRLFAAISNLQSEFESYSELARIFTDSELNKLPENLKQIATEINASLFNIKLLAVRVNDLNVIRKEILKKWFGLMFADKSLNPNIHISLADNLTSDMINEFDKAVSDISIATMWLNSPATTGSPMISIFMKLINQRQIETEVAVKKEIISLEDVINSIFTVRTNSRGQKEYGHVDDAKQRANWFVEKMIDKNHGTLITKYKQDVHKQRMLKWEELRLIAIDNADKGGEKSPNYIKAKKELTQWMRDNYQQEYTIEYIIAKDAVDEILERNQKAKELVDEYRDRIAIKVNGRDRSNLSDEEIKTLNLLEQELHNLSNKYNGVVLKTGEEAVIADVIREWEQARHDFYEKYHEATPNPEFERAYNIAKNTLDPSVFANFLAKNTFSKIKESFWTEYKALAEILYGNNLDDQLSDIKDESDEIKKQYSKEGNYPIAVSLKLKELEERRQALLNNSNLERIIKFTAKQTGDIFVKEFYDILNNETVKLKPAIQDQIDDSIRAINNIIITITDENGVKHSDQLTLTQLNELNENLVNIRDLRKRDSVEDFENKLASGYVTEYDFEVYANAEAQVRALNDPDLLKAWHKVFKRTVFKETFLFQLSEILRRSAAKNKIKITLAEAEELRSIKEGRYDADGVINGNNWSQDMFDIEHNSKFNNSLSTYTPTQQYNIMMNQRAEVQRIHDLEDKFTVPVIYASPVAKSKERYTKEFWEKVTDLSDAAKLKPNVEQYLIERNKLREVINDTLMDIMDAEGVYDSTKLTLTKLSVLENLFTELRDLRKQYDITTSDEVSAFVDTEVVQAVHTVEYNQARQKMAKRLENKEITEDHYNKWLEVFGQIDYEGYYEMLDRNLRDEVIKHLKIPKIEVDTPENTKRINDFIEMNTIEFDKENKELRDKFKDENGEIDVEAAIATANGFSKLNIFRNKFDNKIIRAKGVFALITKGKKAGQRVIRSKNSTPIYRFNQDRFAVENTIYKPTKYYLAKLDELAVKYPIIKLLIKANSDYENRLRGDFQVNADYFEKYRDFAEAIANDKTLDTELISWFDNNHTVTDTGNVRPKGYYLRSTPRTGEVITKPNSLLWSDFAPREKEHIVKYLDTNTMSLLDIAKFEPTEAYKETLRRKIKEVNAIDLTNALELITFKAWYKRNHIFNPYSRTWTPISIWTRLVPIHSNQIVEVPNKQFFGISKMKDRATRTAYLDKAKTDAKKKMNEISVRKPSELYHKVKIEKQLELGLNTPEYLEWYNANHILDKFTGKMKPLSIWMKTLPLDDTNYEHQAPKPHWNTSKPLDSYKNATYEVDRNGDSLPTSKHLDPRYNGVKDNELYKYIISVIPRILDFNERYTEETGNLPVIPNIRENWKTALARMGGIGKNNEEVVEYASKNDELMKFLNIPFMQKLSIKPVIHIDKQGHKEDPIEYQKRILNELAANKIVKEDGSNYTSLKEIYEENRVRRQKNLEFTMDNAQYDPYSMLASFIEHGIDYRTKKIYERERNAYVELVENANIVQTTRSGNPIMAKLNTRFSNLLTAKQMGSNTAEMVKWMRDKFTFDNKPDLTTFEKVLKVARVYTSYNYMALNVVASVGNLLQSGVMQIMETAGGRFVNGKNLRRGYSRVSHGLVDVLANSKANTNNTKDGAILTLMNLQDVWDETGKLSTANMRHLISKIADVTSDVVFFGMYSTEYIVQNTMAMAMLDSHRIVNGKIVNFSDFVGDLRYSLLQNRLTDNQKAEYQQYITEQKSISKEKTDVFVDYFGNWLRTQQKSSWFSSVMNEYISKLKATEKEELANFERFTTVYDAIKLKDGRARLEIEGTDMEQELGEFRIKIRQINNMMFGNYDIKNATKFEDSIYGQIAFQFRKYIKPNYDMYYGNRFGKTQFNEFKNAYDVPAYHAWFRFVTDPIRQNNPFNKKDSNVLAAVFNILTDYATFAFRARALYHTFTTDEKAAIKKVNRQMAIMVMTMLTITLLANLGKGDDDKERSYATWYALYQAYRLYTENFAFTPMGIPGQIVQITKSPTAMTKSMSGIANLAWETARYPFISEEARLIHSGMNVDRTKIGVAAQKASILKPIMMLSDIPQLINYYKMISAFEVDTKGANK